MIFFLFYDIIFEINDSHYQYLYREKKPFKELSPKKILALKGLGVYKNSYDYLKRKASIRMTT